MSSTRASLRAALSSVVVLALVAAAVVLPALGGAAPSAQAAGSPDVSVARKVATQTLYGKPVSVTLTATAPNATPDVDGFNLTFSDVLPVGATIASSSAPVTQTIARPDGTTLVIFTNVADLLDNASVDLTYSFSYPTIVTAGTPAARYDVGDTFTGTAHAYTSTDPYTVPNPLASSTDGSVWEDYTGEASATSTTQLVPYQVRLREITSPEGELLRGVHADKAVFELVVTNNTVAPTTGAAADVFLPASLEFLGCVAADNSATINGTGLEYAGAPRLDASFPAITSCDAGYTASVVTVDPDGAGTDYASGVYTKVTWGLATLAAGSVTTLRYVAAIPLHANVDTGSSAQTLAVANLDNNTGAESADEATVATYAAVVGSYQGGKPTATSYSVAATAKVSAEDVRIVKSVSSDQINQLQATTWTLAIATSEYVRSTGQIVVTDTIPDGLDWAGSPIAPSSGPTANADGTLTVVWTRPALGAQATDSITYQTTTRTTYRAATSTPVSAKDAWINRVHLATSTDLQTGSDGSGTRAVAAVIDDSGAGQSAEPIAIDKTIGAPVAGSCLTGVTWSDDYTVDSGRGAFHPGDTVCYRLDVDFPDKLDTVKAQITDYLPAGFALVGTPAYNTPAHNVSGVSYAANAGSTVLTWTKDEIDEGDYFSVIVTAKITDAAKTQTTDVTGNLMKVRFQNTAGSTFQLRDQADADLDAPLLTLTKTVTTGVTTVKAGESVPYTITVTNTGDQAATSVRVHDVLPAGFSCATTTGISNGGTCAAGTITWTGLTVPADDPATPAAENVVALTFATTVPTTAAPRDSYTNTAGVVSYEGVANTGSPFVYYPKSNISTTVTTAMQNAPAANGSVTVTIADPTITKVVTATDVTETGNSSLTQATIGERITYRITATIPAGSTLYNTPKVTDNVNAALQIVSATATMTADGVTSAPVDVTPTTGQLITAPLGGTSYTNAAGSGDDVLVVTVVAYAKTSVTATKRSSVIGNTGTLTWSTQGSTTARSVTSAAASANITIVEPNITTSKTASSASVVPGQTITYTVRAINTAGTNVSTAYDVDVVDTVPAQLTPLKDGTTTPAATGDLVAPGATWNGTARTITFATVGSIAPGAQASFSYRAVLDTTVVSNGRIQNTAVSSATSLTGTSADERTSTTTVAGYRASSTATVNAPISALTKTRDAADATRTPGQIVHYTLKVTVPANVYAYDFTILDQLPADIRFGGLDTVTCDTACTIDARVIGTPTAAGALVPFYLGDYTASSAVRTVTITYTGIVTPSANNVGRSKVESNTAVTKINTTDKFDDATVTTAQITAAGAYDLTGTNANATVLAVGPLLTLDKNVVGGGIADSRHAKPGETLVYSITLANNGTSPAYDVTVVDSPDARLTGYTATLPGGVTATDADLSDGTLSWTIAGPVAVGATVTISYQATVPSTWTAAQEVVAGPEIVNTADVDYYGVPEATRLVTPTIAYVHYDDVAPDRVDVEVDLASVGDRIWFDVNGNGSQDAGEPGLGGVDVTVLASDGTSVTTTTDATGAWSVANLPGGFTRVTVDTADLPAGLTATYDADGIASAGSWNGPIAENAVRTDIDFGYTGTGSIGDLVWYDQNRNGTKQANEPGIAGRTVTVVWAGQDGSLASTADNVTYTATTTASGAYSVGRLPAGTYSVTVSGMPAGYVAVKDLDAAADGTTTLTLTGGQNRADADFGYAGTASIGDLVWIDRDADGVFDAAGATPEQGVSGAQVQLDWFGVSGGTTVVATFTTTTDTAGLYAFGNLVPGDYRVRVTGGLPASAANTHDRDGNKNSQTPVTLTTGQTVTDADFGYDGAAGLGQRVWWDRNGDGVQDAGEPGFDGVGITALYYGPDGIAATADDRTFTTVTGADGVWSLTGVPLGTYRVTVTAASLPAGFSPTSDADGIATPHTSVVTITGADLTQNFGYRGAYTVGDLVFLDRDADGVQDGGPAGGLEPGLAGVTVELTWGGVTLSTVTDANGAYSFAGIPAGATDVRVLQSSLPAASLAPVSDVEGSATDASAELSLAGNRSDVDFGLRGASSIGDTVWHDRDADGTRDADESGIAGVTVRAVWAGRDGVVGTADDITLSTVTSATGAYRFDHLPAGTWRVVVDLTTLPSGFTAATSEEDGVLDGVDVVTLGASTDHETADFGFRGTGVIGDRVWLDLDGDGTQAGESGIAGQTVTIVWAGRDGAFDGVGDETFTVVTGADGAWSLGNLPDGAFRVSIADGIADIASPTGDRDGTADGTTDVTLSPATRTLGDVDFGYRGANSVGDTVWWDDDRDGVVDAGEPLLAGAEVVVTWAGLDGVAGTADDIATVVQTDALGVYGVAGLPDGRVDLEVTGGIPAGLTAVTSDASSVTFPTTTSTPTVADDQDFGFAGSGSIGDTVWLDEDGDGVQDAGEPGIAQVTVTLTWLGVDHTLGTADDRVWTTTTGSAGTYGFDGLPAGSFHLALTGLPAGLSSTADPDGGADDAADLTLATAENVADQDFGYTGDASVGDLIWLDLDGDGALGTFEVGVSGVVVTVRHAGADAALGTADDIITQTTTDGLGNWAVGGLPAGQIEVSYDDAALTAGYLASSDRDGGDPADSVLTLASGDAIDDVDFAIFGDATLSGVVFDDRNGDGVRQAGEKGVAGIVVSVEWDGPYGRSTITVTTDAQGNWALTGLPPGPYTLTVDGKTVPQGYRMSTGADAQRSLVAGGTGAVIMGITNQQLALTGSSPLMALWIALGLLAGGIVTAAAAKRQLRVADQRAI